MGGIRRVKIEIETPPVAGDSALSAKISALVVAPANDRLAAAPAVLFCLPGGGLTKAYFDLDAEGDRSFSFAEHMARRGHITIALDHPGVGESSKPEDGFLLTPRAVAAVDAAVVERCKAMLRDGLAGLPPLANFKSVGVGHSMGGMLTGYVQAHFAPYDAVAILGSGVHGLVDHLPEPLRPLAGDAELAARELVPRLKALSAAPYRALVRTPLTEAVFFRGEPAGLQAMRRAATPLIVVCGSFSMTPGSWAPEAAQITTPIFLQFGDDDLCPNPHLAPAAYTACPDLTLMVTREMGHCHFVYPTRGLLFERFGAWLDGACLGR